MREHQIEEIAISKFKATCLAVVENVRKTGNSVRVTRFGLPIAEIYPPGDASRTAALGTGAGSSVILGGIPGSVGEESHGEAAPQSRLQAAPIPDPAPQSAGSPQPGSRSEHWPPPGSAFK
jgi:hypothetical protein